MEPIIFARDRESVVLRIVRVVLAFARAGALVGIVTLWAEDEPYRYAPWILLGVVGLQVAALVASLLAPRPAEGDGMILDGEGLRLVAGRRAKRLGWDALARARVQARGVVARVLLGPRIVLRQSDGPGRLPIDGGFLDTQDDMAAVLEAACRQGPGVLSATDLRPTVFHQRDHEERHPRIVATLVGAPILLIAFMAGASAVDGVMDGWDAFLAFWRDPLSHPIVLTVAFGFMVYDGWSGLRKHGARANLLRLDAGGLSLVKNGSRRRWLWDEVTALDLHEEAAPKGNDLVRFLAFTARHDGLSPARVVPPGAIPAAPRCRIDDLYAAPLPAIVEAMAGWRDRAALAGAAAPRFGGLRPGVAL